MSSPVRLSVCRLSVTFVHHTQAIQYFYAIWHLGHSFTSRQNYTEIVPGNPSVVWLNVRGVAEYSDFGPIEGYISETVQDRR